MALVLDSGALIAVERDHRPTLALLVAALRRGERLVVPSTVIAQVWRNGSRQVPLSRFLAGCDQIPLDGERARRIGELLAESAATDIVDASVVQAAGIADTVLTSDPTDIAAIAAARTHRLTIRTV